MNFQKTLVAATLAAASALPLSASALNLGGITFDPGSTWEPVVLYEGLQCASDIADCGGPLTAVGQKLMGVGYIESLKSETFLGSNVWNQSWEDGDNGVQLALYFYDYELESLTGDPGEQVYLFSGGKVEIWLQPHDPLKVDFQQGAWDATDPSNANRIPQGTLFLQLEGSAYKNTTLYGAPITLRATEDGLSISGNGRLDVTGGIAASYFDTNMFSCNEIDDLAQVQGYCPDISDKKFNSIGTLSVSRPAGTWAFTGTGNVYDFAVPEPTSLALLGAGLFGAGLSARRRRKAA